MKFFILFTVLLSLNLFSINSTDRIVVAKEIITLDDRYQNIDAIFIKGDRIHSVGSKDKLSKEFPDIRVDASHENNIIVPGFIEHHIHPLLAGITMNSEIVAIDDWDVPHKKSAGVRDRDGYLKRLSTIENNMSDAEELLVSWGFHHYFHGKLTRQDLDLISKDRPILIIHRSFHEFIMNSSALNLFGITEKDLGHLNKEEKNLASFKEGHFAERGLIAVMPKVMKYIAAPQRIIAGLKITEKYIHQNGITLIANPGSMHDKNIQKAKNFVFGDKETPFRSLYIPSALYMLEHTDILNLLEETKKQLSWGQGKVEFLPNHIKLFTDGAMYSQNMVLRDGYLDGHQGAWLMENDIFKDAFRVFWDAGYQIHVHQNGDAGLDRLLDVLDENMQRNPRKDHRTTVVHFGYSAFDQIERMKRLGVIVSANPYYVPVLSDLYSRKGVGYERSQQMVRLGDVNRAGIVLSLHSDMPMAPASPLVLMHSAVNRINYADEVAGPNQRISALTALKGVTLNSAYTLGIEDNYGSITPGKFANFTILSENPLSIDPLRIDQINVEGTIVEGKLFQKLNIF
ncbi:amidohydrolase [Gammaproteobacteria bacterium]|nr:amidohydrolase [Gammaproteobacteria bacterium]MDA8861963.1 amidohydrolase [Gammaproteobacteria bacterium]MDA8908434.1 amidohydrolase [Gammaproteobacteria bacterium]MDA9986231.1 amidohydrolase [bacterium]MDB9973735.1 amidohydrolase [Gammaproteobacteria bacterium]|tara:strand:+ start:3515 stop:5224 length:1710 start_codon:yes stop_codon:yes gene_type:complete